MEADQKQIKKRPTKWLWSVLILLIIVSGLCGAWLYTHRATGPVPKNIQKAVDFPVYYPDQKKLPTGYTFNTNSFTNPVKNGVNYTISSRSGQKLVFSLQPKPSDNELQSFNSNYIPLHNEYQTPLGNAEIGAYNKQGHTESLISLPTNDSTWIIITGPYNINQNQLQQVLNSLKK